MWEKKPTKEKMQRMKHVYYIVAKPVVYEECNSDKENAKLIYTAAAEYLKTATSYTIFTNPRDARYEASQPFQQEGVLNKNAKLVRPIIHITLDSQLQLPNPDKGSIRNDSHCLIFYTMFLVNKSHLPATLELCNWTVLIGEKQLPRPKCDELAEGEESKRRCIVS